MTKIIKLSDKFKASLKVEVIEIFDILREDYDLDVLITEEMISVIIDEFYAYYEKKEIVYAFYDSFINHFNDLATVAIENDSVVDLDFVLSQLKLFELCDSMMVVDPRDTSKIVQKIYKKYDKE
ncbi:MAG: hypothetical protein IJ463_05865 [Bacilli bacterium]|nr:hypothetical protein [Bacilli bacterium]